MPFADVTGKSPDFPVCPIHTGVAMIKEKRSLAKGETTVWRCPIDHRLYMERSIGVQREL